MPKSKVSYLSPPHLICQQHCAMFLSSWIPVFCSFGDPSLAPFSSYPAGSSFSPPLLAPPAPLSPPSLYGDMLQALSSVLKVLHWSCTDYPYTEDSNHLHQPKPSPSTPPSHTDCVPAALLALLTGSSKVSWSAQPLTPLCLTRTHSDSYGLLQ